MKVNKLLIHGLFIINILFRKINFIEILGGSIREFLMSWNRRIAQSSIFFDLMKEAGFICVHQGKCIYSFTRNNEL